jgi:hypothetical protein
MPTPPVPHHHLHLLAVLRCCAAHALGWPTLRFPVALLIARSAARASSARTRPAPRERAPLSRAAALHRLARRRPRKVLLERRDDAVERAKGAADDVDVEPRRRRDARRRVRPVRREHDACAAVHTGLSTMLTCAVGTADASRLLADTPNFVVEILAQAVPLSRTAPVDRRRSQQRRRRPVPGGAAHPSLRRGS